MVPILYKYVSVYIKCLHYIHGRRKDFFHGMATRGFFQNFSRGRPKMVKFVFSYSKLRKNVFCWVFLNPGGIDNRDVQGRNEVRWCLGQETNLVPPCSNLRSFGSKCTVSKIVLMTLLWLFGPQQWFGARGIVPPCPPSLHLWCYSIKIGKFSENKQIFKFERHELLLHERSAIFEHNRACILYRRPTKVTGGISRFYVWFLSYFYCKRPAEQRFCSGNVFVA